MTRLSFSPRARLFAAFFVVSAFAPAASAATSEWKDHKGATFRGEPIEVLGPLAMFRTGPVSSRFLPLRGFSPEDCVRFYREIANRPARAERWSEAKGQAAAEFAGRLLQAERGQLRAFDFTAVPEPELLVVLYCGRRNPDAASPTLLLDNLAPFINRVQRLQPGRVGAVVWTVRDSHVNPRGLPQARTWLVVDPDKQSKMNQVARFMPGEGFVMVLMTREGVPLLGGPVNHEGELMQFVDGASDILWQLNPANPGGARDRLHYLRAVRPVEFATTNAEPLLLINPLRLEALRQRNVTRVEADFEVGVDGRATRVELRPGSELPAPLAGPIVEALRRGAVFVPAIEQGAPVAGRYRYALGVEAFDPKLAADAAWVNGEARVDVPLPSWLVLKPIKVPDQVFSQIDRVGADGTVMLQAVTAGSANKVSTKSQVNAFNSDWFAEQGVAKLRPVAGETQEVDGQKLVWKKASSDRGLVDFLGSSNYGSLDYCIGYAWTEVELPEDADGWLGIGSDDGLRVWHNGGLVVDRWVERTSRLDDDVTALRLKKGKNQFLIKIQNIKGRWSFTCRLRVRGS